MAFAVSSPQSPEKRPGLPAVDDLLADVLAEPVPETEAAPAPEEKPLPELESEPSLPAETETMPELTPPAPIAQEQPSAEALLSARVEGVLSDGLKEPFLNLQERERRGFKEEGEQIAMFIQQQLQRGGLDRDVLRVRLEHWLSRLGKNQYWAFQEAKIKTDQLSEL